MKKVHILFSSLYLAFIMMTLFSFTTCEDFHPDRTLLIDHFPHTSAPTNFLFRGNMPTVNGTFAYQEILQTMSTVALKQNLTVHPNSSLIVISYLNDFEYSDLKIESDFFKSNPNLGHFYNRVIVGSILSPPQNDTQLIKNTVKLHTESSIDQLPTLMTFMRTQLTQSTGPVLIYTHCEAGTDRTGEVSGAYYITYQNMTFTEALKIDNNVQNRDMEKMSRNGLQWYCFYLRFIKGYETLKCLV